MPLKKFDDSFCSAFLRSMDPERAALDSGCPGEGFAKLAQKHICARLDKMRDDASSQLRREDVVRRLAQLAFGRANDVVKLALHPQDIDPMSRTAAASKSNSLTASVPLIPFAISWKPAPVRRLSSFIRP